VIKLSIWYRSYIELLKTIRWCIIKVQGSGFKVQGFSEHSELSETFEPGTLNPEQLVYGSGFRIQGCSENSELSKTFEP
jgi:hypothetical protein